jgi:hypothetical protein
MKPALPKRTAKSPTCDRRCSAARWMKFNAVGGIGIGVQWAVLLYLKSGFHLSYLVATALAVEAAVARNYFWHERFTWGDRVRVRPGANPCCALCDLTSLSERSRSSAMWRS